MSEPKGNGPDFRQSDEIKEAFIESIASKLRELQGEKTDGKVSRELVKRVLGTVHGLIVSHNDMVPGLDPVLGGIGRGVVITGVQFEVVKKTYNLELWKDGRGKIYLYPGDGTTLADYADFAGDVKA